jgi:hypothetical protein
LGSLFGNPGVATQQEERFSVIGEHARKAEAQGSSGDPFRVRGILEECGPDQWHVIVDDEVGLLDEGLVPGKMVAAQQVVQVGCDDVATSLLIQGIDDPSTRFGFGDGIKDVALQINAGPIGFRIQLHLHC